MSVQQLSPLATAEHHREVSTRCEAADDRTAMSSIAVGAEVANDVLGTRGLRHVALDTESTGLDPSKARIVEIAIVEFEPATGSTGKHFHTLVNPGCPIPPECSAIHGITDDRVAGAPKFRDILPDIGAFLKGSACVIHNANYDTALLTAELKRLKMHAFANMVEAVVDTLKIARQVLPGRKHKLDSLCDHYGIDRSARSLHGALVDCSLLAAVYPHLRGNLTELARALSGRLPFGFGDPVPDTVEECAVRWLQLNDLHEFVLKEQKRYHERAKSLSNGERAEGSNWVAEFHAKCITEWDKVTAIFLGGIDLGPYRKHSNEFRIRWKSD